MDYLRLNKRISNSGLCSRRDADLLIAEGKVKVNGVVVNKNGIRVSEKDVVSVNEKELSSKQETRIWIYHKPKGVIVTHNDKQGRPTVFASLPTSIPRVISIGRLDINSEGLLLLTNDSSIARQLELPDNNYARTYKVRVYGKIDQEKLLKISQGIEINGIKYKKFEASVIYLNKNNSWLKITLYEGKNREIRKLMQYLGLEVNRLIRVQYGQYFLGNLTQGAVKEVKKLIV